MTMNVDQFAIGLAEARFGMHPAILALCRMRRYLLLTLDRGQSTMLLLAVEACVRNNHAEPYNRS